MVSWNYKHGLKINFGLMIIFFMKLMNVFDEDLNQKHHDLCNNDRILDRESKFDKIVSSSYDNHLDENHWDLLRFDWSIWQLKRDL